MNNSIELVIKGQSQLVRSTTAGKTDNGNLAFLGGAFYLKNIDPKFKDGTFNSVTLSCILGYEGRVTPVSILAVGESK